MPRHMGVYKVFTAQAVGTSATVTSSAFPIDKLTAIALHLTDISGTTPDVTFTYSLCNTENGTFVVPASPSTIGANKAAADVMDFSPEAAKFIKIRATNNSGANIATITAELAVQID